MESSRTIRTNAIGIFPTSSNPAYVWEDFTAIFPQFDGLIPISIFAVFRNLAMKTLSVEQWGQEAWVVGMAYFIAHFLTLYLKCTPRLGEGEQATADMIISSAAPGGILKEKAANTLKMVYDNTINTKGIEDGGSFLLTTFGQNYLTQAKFMRMPMYV